MKAFTRYLYVLIWTVFCVSCGGGGGGAAPFVPPPVINASPGGIWTGIDSDGDLVIALVTETGRFNFLDEFGNQGSGILSVSNGNDVAGNFQLVTPLGITFPDGTTLADCTLSGTVSERLTMTVTADCTTMAGLQDQITVTLDYETIYERDSSLATIAGMYNDGSGIVTEIASDGTIFEQDPVSGCVTNGQVNIIDPAFNAYDVQFGFSNCTGQFTNLNGTSFVGIATLDNTVTPEALIVAATGDVAGTLVSFVSVSERLPPQPPPPPPPVPLQLDDERVFDQLTFNSPVALVQAPGDSTRWFAVEQSGIVRVFDNDPTVSSSAVFVDISGRVDSGPSEAGLLGIAFDPDFPLVDDVYLSYTRTGAPLVSVISRFSLDPATGNLDASSEFEILTVLQDFGNHNGGNIAFGPDGFLYIGFGDGGSGGDPNNRAQDTNFILGSIVRLDVDVTPPARYAIPPTNPFFGNTDCPIGTGVMACPEIYALGLRNPWRFSFDSQTGELWVGDVGQNSWEEIDRVDLGMNYGWNHREGAHCYPPAAASCDLNNVDPITEYDHSVGNSVTGGYVYRGTVIPALQGTYVFGDFGSGRIWGVPANSAQGVVPELLVDTTLNISSFAEGVDGELYALDYGGGGIYQIIDAP